MSDDDSQDFRQMTPAMGNPIVGTCACAYELPQLKARLRALERLSTTHSSELRDGSVRFAEISKDLSALAASIDRLTAEMVSRDAMLAEKLEKLAEAMSGRIEKANAWKGSLGLSFLTALLVSIAGLIVGLLLGKRG